MPLTSGRRPLKTGWSDADGRVLHFFDRQLQEQYPEKLLYGGLFSSVVLIAGGVSATAIDVFVFAPTVAWFDLVLACVSVGISIVLVIVMMMIFRRQRRLDRIPPLALLATVAATAAVGFGGVAGRGGLLVASLLVLPVVAVGLFGDRLTLVVEWAAAVAVAAWSLSAQDTPKVMEAVVVLAIVLAATEISIALVMRFMARNIRLLDLLRDFDQLIALTMTHREALEVCITRITQVSSVREAVVLVGVPELGFRTLLVAAGDGDEPSDHAALNTDPDVAEVARTGLAIVRDDYAILPVGYTDDGSIIVALRRPAGGVLAAVDEIPTDMVTAALSRVAMRVSSFQRLETLSTTDALTGLFNRRALLDRLRLETEHADRDGRTLCVAMIDLDHFKRYNDTYGHLAGDEVLKEVARLFRGRLRRVDSPSRYGGEEFCLVLPDIAVAAAIELLDDLRGRVAGLHLFEPVTFSAGVASYRSGESLTALIGRADATLYEAKDRGRNQVLGADDRIAPVPS